MWIVGGETFSYSHHLDMVAIFSPDLNNQDGQGIWTPVHAKGEKGPSPRYGHSAVIHDDKVNETQCPKRKERSFIFKNRVKLFCLHFAAVCLQ